MDERLLKAASRLSEKNRVELQEMTSCEVLNLKAQCR
jgi:hypothetical protein